MIDVYLIRQRTGGPRARLHLDDIDTTLTREEVLDLQQKLAALEWPTPEAADVEFDVERTR